MLRTHLSLCTTKSIKVDLENKEMDQFLERLVSLCSLFSFTSFLAEFPSGVQRLAKPTNFAGASKMGTGRHFVSPLLRETGKMPVAYVGGANLLSRGFIGIPHKPSYSAPCLH